jgi:hypothetical protein
MTRQAGTIIDCIGTIKDGGNIDHDYAGTGLARLYESRKFTARQTDATILQFSNGERLANGTGNASNVGSQSAGKRP